MGAFFADIIVTFVNIIQLAYRFGLNDRTFLQNSRYHHEGQIDFSSQNPRIRAAISHYICNPLYYIGKKTIIFAILIRPDRIRYPGTKLVHFSELSAGSRMINRLPLSAPSLSTQREPPCERAMPRAKNNPSPGPAPRNFV